MKIPASAPAPAVRRRLATVGAVVVGALGVAVPAALASYGPIAPPSNLPPTVSAVVISTAVNGRHVVRANLADKFAHHRFAIFVNGKVVARGTVHAKGRFTTWFKRTLARGAMITIRVRVGTHLVTVIRKRA